jgi:menaquinone-specific isochorismate synthase
LSASQKRVLKPGEFRSFLGSGPGKLSKIQWQEPSHEEYLISFNLHYEKIQKFELSKAVPFVFDRSDSRPNEDQIWHFLKQLSDFQNPLIPYGYWNETSGFLGLTPEILFHKKGLVITSMAVAGTEKKTGSPPRLQMDTKIKKEHQFVADELSKRWGELGPVDQSPLQVLELPTLFHLLTNFRVQLKNEISPEKIVSLFHPTSAVGAIPHEKWRSLEDIPGQKERGFYGAPVLFQLSELEHLALVALRQVQWDKNGMRLGAGGGILLESQQELEWDEVLAKIESVKKLLKI